MTAPRYAILSNETFNKKHQYEPNYVRHKTELIAMQKCNCIFIKLAECGYLEPYWNFQGIQKNICGVGI